MKEEERGTKTETEAWSRIEKHGGDCWHWESCVKALRNSVDGVVRKAG